MTRFTTWTSSSLRPPTTTHRCVPNAHTLPYTQRDASIDAAHLTLTKGVLSALVVDDTFLPMDHRLAETSDYHA